MKRNVVRIICLVLALVLLAPCVVQVLANEQTDEAVILFTHDLHSHLLPAEKEEGGEYGGFSARRLS